MRILALFFLSFCACSISLNAQTTTLKNWFIDQQEAMVYAQENNTNILMVFSGSDWCRPCIKFKNDILTEEAFASFANNHLAILYLDFPAKKKNKLSPELTTQNEGLAENYNQSGIFPKIILVDSEMNKIKELKYTGESSEDFIKTFELY